MDGFQTDDRTEAAQDDHLATDPGPAWSGVSRGPRPPAEGVRIIGAEEAAAAIEAGQVSPRVPDDAPRFGDVPQAPPGPQPPLRFPGSDPTAVSKPPPVAAPEPRPAYPSLPPSIPPPPDPGPEEPSWSGTLSAPPDAGPVEDGRFWDSPVVATASPGRFEELVAAAAAAEARSRAEGGQPEHAAEPQLRQITPDRPLTSDPVSGEWAVASGLGGGVGPGTGGRAGGPRLTDPNMADAGRSLTGPEPGPAAVPSDWDRLTGTTSGGGQVGERGAWDFLDEPAQARAADEVPQAAGEPVVAEPPMALPHWTEPATGEVPLILADAPPPVPPQDEELSAWSALSTGPRWRDQPADWDEADFSDTVLDDREGRLGALRDQPEADEDDGIFSFDEAAVPVAAAPAPRGRGRGAATQVRPARRTRQPGTGGVPGGAGRGSGGTGRGSGGGGSGGGTEMSSRVVTGVIAAGVLLAAAAIGPRALVVIVLAAVTVAAAELFQGLRTRGYQPATLLGLVGCAAMVAGAYWRGEQAFPLVLTLVVIFSFLWYLAGVVHAKPTMNIAVTVFAFVYVGFLGSYASLLLRWTQVDVNGTGIQVHRGWGLGLLLGAVIATAAHDIGAFLVGKYMGKTPLAPELSPNKTFEGLVGGVLASVFISLVVVSQIKPWDAGKAFWLGVIVAIAAPLGDLCESMIKRDLGVKDMGKILPGHGGVLDRVDALLFVIPATYYLARLLF